MGCDVTFSIFRADHQLDLARRVGMTSPDPWLIVLRLILFERRRLVFKIGAFTFRLFSQGGFWPTFTRIGRFVNLNVG